MTNFFGLLSPFAEKLLNEIKKEENDIDPEKLVCTKSDENLFNFNTFKSSLKFASNIYNGNRIISKMDQYKMLKQLKELEGYNPKKLDKITSTKEIN